MPVRYAIVGNSARDIAESVETAVAGGALAPGDRLPPLRQVADDLSVNPNTVAAAYRLLRDRGIVETDGRRGTRVRPRPASTPRWQPGPELPPGAIDLSTGSPDPDLLPRLPAWPRQQRTTYGAEDVSEALARAAAARLRADGVVGQGLAVCSSALDAVERVLGAHLRPGDRVVVEDPGWASLFDLVAALGLVADPVAVDDDGMDVDALAGCLQRGARAVVLTSRAQNPTGGATSASRARALRRVLRQHPTALVVEDDHAAEVAGVPLHPVVGTTGHWAFVRSVGKAWGPDLRAAPMTGDAVTVDRVRGRLRLGPGWVSHLLQDTTAAMWADAGAARAVERAGEAYAARRAALITALDRRGVRAYGRSGLNVWVPVRDETAAVTRLLAAGYAVAPGARFRLRSEPAVRLTVAALGLRAIGPAADAVAAAVTAASGGARV